MRHLCCKDENPTLQDNEMSIRAPACCISIPMGWLFMTLKARPGSQIYAIFQSREPTYANLNEVDWKNQSDWSPAFRFRSFLSKRPAEASSRIGHSHVFPAIWRTTALACHQGRRLPTRRANSQLPRSAADMTQNKGGIPKVAPTAPNNSGMTV